jgi:predicted TIM-barrel fold metal-dependent hydrolase
MNKLPDDVMGEIRERVQAGRQAWEESLRAVEDQRLLDLLFGESGEGQAVTRPCEVVRRPRTTTGDE